MASVWAKARRKSLADETQQKNVSMLKIEAFWM
jgi:hypothetical protein